MTIPVIGDKGIYTVSSPYNDVISPNVTYTCVALRSIGDYITEGIDIYTLLYKAYGLSTDVYKTAIDRKEIVATLQSKVGRTFLIPCSYITKMPDPNGRLYRSLMMYVSLGNLPVNLKTGTLEREVKDFVASKLGITPEVGIVENSEPFVITNEEHVRLEQQRYNRITDSSTMTAKIKKLTEENSSLVDMLKKYQEAIIKLKNK